MRLRVSLLVVATSSLVLVSFLVPLALVLRTLAADRATSAAAAEAQSLAPLVTTLPVSSLRLTVDQVNAENQYAGHRLPAGRAPSSASREPGHARGRGWPAAAGASQPRLPGGEQVLVAVEGLRGRLRRDPRLRARLGAAARRDAGPGCCSAGSASLLLLLSVAGRRPAGPVPGPPARPRSPRPPTGWPPGNCRPGRRSTGPPEVRRAGAGLNRLAVRIGELLAHERETVADLSHRLRTPLTALRIDAESLRDGAEMERLLADVGAARADGQRDHPGGTAPGPGRRGGYRATRPGWSPNGPRSGGRSPKTRTAG